MLTQDQLTTLKAAMLADPIVGPLVQAGDWWGASAALNQQAVPDYIVWKTAVHVDEIMQNGFDWTQVDNTTVGKARIWEWMFANESRSINASKANIRAGVDEAWRGTAAMLAVRAAVYAHCKRSALLGEKMLATGTGTNNEPATMGYEGGLGAQDVADAMQKG